MAEMNWGQRIYDLQDLILYFAVGVLFIGLGNFSAESHNFLLSTGGMFFTVSGALLLIGIQIYVTVEAFIDAQKNKRFLWIAAIFLLQPIFSWFYLFLIAE